MDSQSGEELTDCSSKQRIYQSVISVASVPFQLTNRTRELVERYGLPDVEKPVRADYESKESDRPSIHRSPPPPHDHQRRSRSPRYQRASSRSPRMRSRSPGRRHMSPRGRRSPSRSRGRSMERGGGYPMEHGFRDRGTYYLWL